MRHNKHSFNKRAPTLSQALRIRQCLSPHDLQTRYLFNDNVKMPGRKSQKESYVGLEKGNCIFWADVCGRGWLYDVNCHMQYISPVSFRLVPVMLGSEGLAMGGLNCPWGHFQ